MTLKTKSDLQLVGIALVTAVVIHFIFSGLLLLLKAERIISVLLFIKHFLYALVILVCVLGITYKRFWTGNTFSSAFKAVFLGGVFLSVFILAFQSFVVFDQINSLYNYVKKPAKGMEGKFFMADDWLGHRAIPNRTGYHTFYINEIAQGKIPIYTNELGCRAPKAKLPFMESDTTNLFLGCSFTWGDYTIAEETYPYLVSEQLGNNYINAGVSAYGLTQMLIRYKELAKDHSFKYVFVQYSPWLYARAVEKYGPTFFGYRPYAYVTKNDTGSFIHPPLFKTSLYDVPIDYFKTSPTSIIDKLKFICRVGIPVLVTDYIKKLFYDFCVKVKIYPRPNYNKSEVINYIYSEIYKLCEANHSKMIIVKLLSEDSLIYGIDNRNMMTIVDADSLLGSKIPKGEKYHEQYNRTYLQTVWDGKDTVVFDEHFNYQAHQVITEAIMSRIKK